MTTFLSEEEPKLDSNRLNFETVKQKRQTHKMMLPSFICCKLRSLALFVALLFLGFQTLLLVLTLLLLASGEAGQRYEVLVNLNLQSI